MRKILNKEVEMKTRITIMLSVFFLLVTVGTDAGAQYQRRLLPGELIPKFLDPLPVAGDITVVDATKNVFRKKGNEWTKEKSHCFSL